jgi:hypothetical protein
MQYIIHNFHINYQQKPNIFEFLSSYEFFDKVNKINNTHYNIKIKPNMALTIYMNIKYLKYQ